MSEPFVGSVVGNPWDRRSELGFVAALIETVKLFITSPAEAYRQTLAKGDFAGPLIFAVVVGWIGSAISHIWALLFGFSMMGFMQEEFQGGDLMPMAAMSGAGTIVGLLVTPIFIAIGLFIWSGILHLCLMVVGGLNDSEAGFEGTFRALSFGSVAQLANIIPFIGGLIALVWSIILAVIGLSTLHRTTQGKAVLAILIPVVLCDGSEGRRLASTGHKKHCRYLR